jgi:hypothetical protein
MNHIFKIFPFLLLVLISCSRGPSIEVGDCYHDKGMEVAFMEITAKTDKNVLFKVMDMPFETQMPIEELQEGIKLGTSVKIDCDKAKKDLASP